jgi:hypothetical protein
MRAALSSPQSVSARSPMALFRGHIDLTREKIYTPSAAMRWWTRSIAMSHHVFYHSR